MFQSTTPTQLTPSFSVTFTIQTSPKTVTNPKLQLSAPNNDFVFNRFFGLKVYMQENPTFPIATRCVLWRKSFEFTTSRQARIASERLQNETG
jgi:hypothetical protein